jgi:16S rRNA (adenine1518-N6/adenine1519-N6)-dimethyltransferase
MPEPTIDKPGDLLALYQRHAKKQFGQHFLTDPTILDGLIDEAGVRAGDSVLEVGPGCGTLTWSLLERGAGVRAVELDRDAAAFLTDVLGPGRRLDVMQGDVLDIDVDELLDPIDEEPSWRCVSNLPYNAATEIFFHLAPAFDRFECLVLMFQREVADRFVADVGSDDFGALTLTSRLYADAEVVQTLAPGAFQPPPQVHSSAVRFDPVPGTRIQDPALRARFIEVVRSAFQRRRKILPNALGGLDVEKSEIEAAMERVGLKRTIRPERVDFDGFRALADALNQG